MLHGHVQETDVAPDARMGARDDATCPDACDECGARRCGHRALPDDAPGADPADFD